MNREELRAKVDGSRNFAIALMFILVATYYIYFVLFIKAPYSTDPAAWGQFGDFIGGILNPLIAFLAFYWLTQSIQMQKDELEITQKALQDSANAQLQQEKHTLMTARINALSALLSSYNNDISTLRNNQEFISSQLRESSAVISPQGQMLSHLDARRLLGEVSGGLQKALNSRMDLTDEITALLRAPNV